MTRVGSTLKNLKFGMLYNIITILLNLIVRLIFLHYISIEYLGASGLFSSIFSILSFTEAGIGSAITYSLYKPLSENDKESVISLMQLYKISYRCIGTIVLVIGILLIPSLPFFTNNSTLPNLTLIYIMFLINSVITYWFADIKSLIMADQKGFIISINNAKFYICQCILEIIIIVLYKNYILYLLIQIVFTIMMNINLYFITRKMYNYIYDNKRRKISETQKNTLVKNIKAIFLAKIGKTIIGSTDNIVISNQFGLVSTGVLSNYTMIINNVENLAGVIHHSATASIGNLNAREDVKYRLEIFEKLDFLYFSIYFLTGCIICCLSSPFLSLINRGFVLDYKIQIVLVINYFINGLRVCTTQFKETSGLYWEDRYKFIIEGCMNFTLSLILVQYLGLFGVLVATTISAIFVGMWYEEKVLFDNVFNKNFFSYFIKNILRIILLVISCLFLMKLSIYFSSSIMGFIMYGIATIVIIIIFYCTLFFRNKNFKYFAKFVLSVLRNIFNLINNN